MKKKQTAQYESALVHQELSDNATRMLEKKAFVKQLQSFVDETGKTNLKTVKQHIRELISDFLEDEEAMSAQARTIDANDEAFLGHLKTQLPNLSKREMYLCLYINKGLASKEIAVYFNASLAAIEKARYRLRKKMDMESEQSLGDFLEKMRQ